MSVLTKLLDGIPVNELSEGELREAKTELIVLLHAVGAAIVERDK